MTIWLNADQVAERLGVARRTAIGMMQEMHPVTISGSVRKRIRVSEESFEKWMISRCEGKDAPVSRVSTGVKKKLTRR